jgi:hypothetical protein
MVLNESQGGSIVDHLSSNTVFDVDANEPVHNMNPSSKNGGHLNKIADSGWLSRQHCFCMSF